MKIVEISFSVRDCAKVIHENDELKLIFTIIVSLPEKFAKARSQQRD